uniref:Sulfotransferase family protein n=1 Tax=Candidatus Kentrum sp. DK TaxID=2126562 RepID=A0A450T6B2_9GAMM|nr:MAG: hypothetical protein BECKDK2373C_GA0170839_10959 [Candidatus Kentron sp. DK]
MIESAIIKDTFSTMRRVHVKKPFYKKKSHYIIVVRNPISRAQSAFNWRYKLVVETKEQEFRFAGEYEVLEKYRSLNNLAEELYCNGEISLDAAKDWLMIHHLKENISFYLSDVLKSMRSDQIFAVLTQECLDSDIERFLGVKNTRKLHEHRSKTDDNKLKLSDAARYNLKQFLIADYEAIIRLSELFSIDEEALKKLLA